MSQQTSTVQSSIATSVDYYHTQEFKDLLITQLDRFPANMQLVPIRQGAKVEKGKQVGFKAPIGLGWEMRPIDRSEIRELIQSGKAWGFGLKLGVAGNGILAIDVDGLAAQAGLESILAGLELPKTVKFTSGKIGRSQLLFRVSQAQWFGLARKAQKFGDEDLDFRWGYDQIDKDGNEESKGFQSCLPGTFHSLEYGTYQWVDGCSPDDVEIAELPQVLLDFWLSILNPVKPVVPASKAKATLSTPYPENKDFDSMLKASAVKLANLAEGSRNPTLNKEAFTLAGLSGNDPDKLQAIRVELTAAAFRSGLEQPEIGTTIESGISKGVLKQIAPYGCEQPQKLPSLYAADLLVSDVLTNIKFDTHASQWFEYDGKGKWNPVMDARIQKLAKDYLRGVLPPFSLHYLNECIALARTDVQVDGWSEMSSLFYLPFTNGVLDIKANQFLPHSPDYHFTWQLPRAYAPQLGEWLQIDRFLDTLANNDSGLKQLAIAFCNAVLKGRSDLQKFLYLFGEGGNGKGAFMNLLKMLIGSENIHSTTMGELNGNRFESANLKGKRLLVMSDEDKRSGGVGVFKSATGGDSLR